MQDRFLGPQGLPESDEMSSVGGACRRTFGRLWAIRVRSARFAPKSTSLQSHSMDRQFPHRAEVNNHRREIKTLFCHMSPHTYHAVDIVSNHGKAAFGDASKPRFDVVFVLRRIPNLPWKATGLCTAQSLFNYDKSYDIALLGASIRLNVALNIKSYLFLSRNSVHAMTAIR